MVRPLRQSKAKLAELETTSRSEDALITVRGKVKARLAWARELQALILVPRRKQR